MGRYWAGSNGSNQGLVMKKNSIKYMIYSLLFSNTDGVSLTTMIRLIDATKMTVKHEIRNLRKKGVNIVFNGSVYFIKE